MQLVTNWGTRRIVYSLHLEDRRDLLIRVDPDLTVVVYAPRHKQLEFVLGRVKARRAWIASQLSRFERWTPLPAPRFVSGETVVYLGREYRLRLERGRAGALLHAGRLHVGIGQRKDSARAAREVILDWYRDRATTVVRRRLMRLQVEIGMLRSLQPQLRIRRMSRRWGSCTSRGTITINPALIQAPVPCVDYVLVHELIHVMEATHSSRFYGLLSQVLPDWVRRRERLAAASVRWYE